MEIQKLTEKLQVLITKEESAGLNSAILNDAIEDNQRPVSVSAYIRSLIKKDLLQNGLCKVFNKIKNEFVKNIEMREYNFQFGPLIGEGGRNFLADGEVFFSVEDCIS